MCELCLSSKDVLVELSGLSSKEGKPYATTDMLWHLVWAWPQLRLRQGAERTPRALSEALGRVEHNHARGVSPERRKAKERGGIGVGVLQVPAIPAIVTRAYPEPWALPAG